MSEMKATHPSKSESVKLFDNSTSTDPLEIDSPSLPAMQHHSFQDQGRESLGKVSMDKYTHVDEQPYVTLPSKYSMAMVGLGTWKSAPGEVKDAVVSAIKSGYRHIDCAAIYQNESEVGEALSTILGDEVVSRSDLFITSKLWNTHWRDVQAACEKTLKDLGLSFLDLYLIHWPASSEAADILKTWQSMESLVEQGLVRSIGVSNFSPVKLKIILDSNPKIKPAVNQIEAHPYHRNTELINYCALNDIHVTAYSPLGSPDSAGMMKRDPSALGPMSDPIILKVAEEIGKSPAQVLIRWAIQRGTSVLPKSVKASRLISNIDVFQWTLSPEAMKALSSLEKQERMVAGQFLVDAGSYKSLSNLWDEEEPSGTSSQSRL